MAGHGIYLALNSADIQKLLIVRNNTELLAYLHKELALRRDDAWQQQTEHTWEVLHRCLGDGTLRRTGKSVLGKCVLGGRQLYRGNEYIISFLAPEEVGAVAQALAPLTRGWMRKRYFALKKQLLWFNFSDYNGPLTEHGFATAWGYFEQVRAFFQKAAAENRAMIFSVE